MNGSLEQYLSYKTNLWKMYVTIFSHAETSNLKKVIGLILVVQLVPWAKKNVFQTFFENFKVFDFCV